jgi:hypothetical protein
MAKFNSKKEWENTADRLISEGKTPQEINQIVGEYNGPEGRFTVQQAKSSKRGWVAVDKNNREKRNAKRVEMERSQSMGVGDTVEPRGTTSTSLRSELGAGKGMEIHHRISLIQNTPFFDGLNETEQREFVTWANKQGWKLGNQPGNPEIIIPKADHTATHGWLRQNDIEGPKGPQKRIQERIRGMNIDDRKFAFRNYMEYVQGGADEFMLDSLGEKSVSPSHNEAQQQNREFLARDAEAERLRNSVGTIESGPRKGQPLPVNRRTLGDAIIKDLRLENGSIKVGTKGLIGRGLARAALPSVIGGAASLALGAGDVQAREERAQQDPSFINKFQAGLARTEQAADVAGMVPGPQTAVAEPVGLGAGLTNVAIDVARDPMGTLQAVGGGLKYLANEYVLRGAMTAP